MSGWAGGVQGAGAGVKGEIQHSVWYALVVVCCLLYCVRFVLWWVTCVHPIYEWLLCSSYQGEAEQHSMSELCGPAACGLWYLSGAVARKPELFDHRWGVSSPNPERLVHCLPTESLSRMLQHPSLFWWLQTEGVYIKHLFIASCLSLYFAFILLWITPFCLIRVSALPNSSVFQLSAIIICALYFSRKILLWVNVAVFTSWLVIFFRDFNGFELYSLGLYCISQENTRKICAHCKKLLRTIF